MMNLGVRCSAPARRFARGNAQRGDTRIDNPPAQEVHFEAADHFRLDAAASGILKEESVGGALNDACPTPNASVRVRQIDLANTVTPLEHPLGAYFETAIYTDASFTI